MKTTKKQFDLFKSECKQWINKFQLNSWEVNFHHEDPNFERADCSLGADCTFRRVDVKFSVNNFDEEVFNNQYIKDVAKHEMIHLLIEETKDRAYNRFLKEDDIVKANEELVRKIENIIK